MIDDGLGQGWLTSITGGFATNKERAAVVADEYFTPYARTIAQVWPHLFPLSVASTLVSGMLLWKRWDKGVDARILWGGLLVASAGAVYGTFPFAGEPQLGERFLEWVDRRREDLRAEDPNFANRILRETMELPGLRDFIPSPVVAMLTA